MTVLSAVRGSMSATAFTLRAAEKPWQRRHARDTAAHGHAQLCRESGCPCEHAHVCTCTRAHARTHAYTRTHTHVQIKERKVVCLLFHGLNVFAPATEQFPSIYARTTRPAVRLTTMRMRVRRSTVRVRVPPPRRARFAACGTRACFWRQAYSARAQRHARREEARRLPQSCRQQRYPCRQSHVWKRARARSVTRAQKKWCWLRRGGAWHARTRARRGYNPIGGTKPKASEPFCRKVVFSRTRRYSPAPVHRVTAGLLSLRRTIPRRIRAFASARRSNCTLPRTLGVRTILCGMDLTSILAARKRVIEGSAVVGEGRGIAVSSAVARAANPEKQRSALLALGAVPARVTPQNIAAGLVNQGATCYLNSLLQVMWATRELRASCYGTADAHGHTRLCALCVCSARCNPGYVAPFTHSVRTVTCCCSVRARSCGTCSTRHVCVTRAQMQCSH
ncbi:hypothetical protein EON67_02625, partial [archaeon]